MVPLSRTLPVRSPPILWSSAQICSIFLTLPHCGSPPYYPYNLFSAPHYICLLASMHELREESISLQHTGIPECFVTQYGAHVTVYTTGSVSQADVPLLCTTSNTSQFTVHRTPVTRLIARTHHAEAGSSHGSRKGPAYIYPHPCSPFCMSLVLFPCN